MADCWDIRIGSNDVTRRRLYRKDNTPKLGGRFYIVAKLIMEVLEFSPKTARSRGVIS